MELEHAADELLFRDALDEHQASGKEHLAAKAQDEALDGARVRRIRFLGKPPDADAVPVAGSWREAPRVRRLRRRRASGSKR